MTSKKTKDFSALLDRLEAVYGRMIPTDDAVEAGLLALLAEHAPHLSTEPVRDQLRAAFVDWNEMRVAEPWDVVVAVGGGGDAAARKYARAALKYLRSVHSVLNRCSFERAPGEPEVDLPALVAKVRGASAGARAVCAAVATKSWLPNADMSKLLQRLDVIGKTSSVAKAGKALEGVAEPSDHVRAHYLLARYVSRSKEDPAPLQTGAAGRRAAKKASQEAQRESDAVVTPAADAPSKSVSSKSGASKTDAPKTGVSKSTSSKAVAAKTKKAS
jgi:hypothetical protein